MRPQSKSLIIIATVNLILIYVSLYFNLSFTHDISNDGEVLNELGVIRGTIQRVTKLGISGQDYEDISLNADRLIEKYKNQFLNGQGNTTLSNDLIILDDKFTELTIKLKNYEEDPKLINEVVALSETCWVLSNSIVYNTQYLYKNKLLLSNFISFILLFNGILFIYVISRIKKYVRDYLEIKATYDTLTHVYNRSYFQNHFDNSLLKADQSHPEVSLLLFDIDLFKNVNDTYGHNVGDDVLVELCEVVKKALRDKDVFARVGGEEFVVHLSATGLTEAMFISERIRKSVEVHTFKTVGQITISLGISTFRENDDRKSMILRADNNMYKAKELGRNQSYHE